MGLIFYKMHGLGNDFVVLDARRRPLAMDSARARALADRKTGVGCDQLILLEPPRDQSADLAMRIFNADGGEVEACGNATRCVAQLHMRESASDHATIETVAGLLQAHAVRALIKVDMGPARLDWRDIPLAQPCDTLDLPLERGPLAHAVGVGMGNPHAVFFVADIEAIDLPVLGPALEHDRLFPQRANIGIAQILDRGTIRLRVWERGAGITLACGTGACAALVAAARRGLTGYAARVALDGGVLDIEWREADGHVLMTGPAVLSFTGELAEDFPEVPGL